MIQAQAGIFFLDTCQRWVWVSPTPLLIPRVPSDSEMEVYQGPEAYLFLLQLATGLKSQVLGETDIFGQFKTAWRVAYGRNRSSLSELHPWIQKIFEDTKAIRTQYLQNLGGASYGSLVRKLLRNQKPNQQPKEKMELLVVGAGQIAHSILPFLFDYSLSLWNRNPIRLCSFYDEILSLPNVPSPIQIRKWKPEQEQEAWTQAQAVVVCTPLDPSRDPIRVQWLLNLARGRVDSSLVVHLGGYQDQCSTWTQLPQFYSLTQLFELQENLGDLRSIQVTQAQQACHEKTKLRSLGGSLSLSHGWEDLMNFA